MLCPMCNGFGEWQDYCSYCEHEVVDYGRIADYAGPYAPYGQMEDDLQENKAERQLSAECRHLLYCPACGRTAEAVWSKL
jgi:hypothetical protein